MKIKDLIDRNKVYFHHEIRNTIDRYYDDDCVIAYKKCFMGMVIIFEGKRRYFSFVVITPKEIQNLLYLQINGLNIGVENSAELINDGGVIVNKKEWEKIIRDKMLFNLK